jgi:hypothetical protein
MSLTDTGSYTLSSTATFPALPAATHALLDEIIQGLPADAHTFEHVFTRYKDVLALHGLDPADDEEGYASLLKLSMQRGATWKDKWRSAQQALPNSPAVPRLDVLRARLDSLDATYNHPTPSSSKLRPTSYPLTSTPRHDRTYRTDATEVTLTSSPPSPPSRHRRVSFLSPHSSNVFSPPQTTHVFSPIVPHHEDPPMDYARVHDPLIAASDAFRRSALLSHHLDAWRTCLESAQTLERKTAQIRNKLLVKRALAIWRLRLKLVESVLVPKAEAWGAVALKRRILREWADRAAGARKSRWEGQMRAALEAVRGLREGRILISAWDVSLISSGPRTYLTPRADLARKDDGGALHPLPPARPPRAPLRQMACRDPPRRPARAARARVSGRPGGGAALRLAGEVAPEHVAGSGAARGRGEGEGDASEAGVGGLEPEDVR